MQESIFKRELNKCRVVRRDDHHKVRWKKIKESLPTSNAKESKAAIKKNNKSKPTSAAVDMSTPFWKEIQEVAGSVLNADECNRFMNQLKLEYATVIEKVNLSDLEAGLNIA